MFSDKKFLFTILAAAMFVAVSPFAVGQAITPAGAQFYGNKLIAPADYSIYYSYIHQGAQGHAFMYDAFTSEPHAATLFQPLWLVAGLGAQWFHLSAPAAFAIARYLSVPVFILTLWWAVGWLWPDNERRRRIALVMAIVASGLGGIAAMIGLKLADFPWTYPDLWVSEAYSVLTLWSSAHFLLVTSGIVFVLVAVERSWLEKRWSWTLWAGLAALATVSIHPFHIITWCILWIGLTVWRWLTMRRIPWGYIGRWLSVVAMASPMLFLYGLQLLYDPLTINRAVQNINATAKPWAMIIGLGLPLLFSLVALFQWKPKDERWRWLVGLGAAYFIAAYIPVPFQRRLTQGMILPFAWLSVPVVEHLIFSSRQRSTRWLTGAALGLVMSSSWLLIGGGTIKDYFRDLKDPIRMYAIDAEHRQLAVYLETTDPHQPLLASLLESNVLAGLTAHQVYVGYGVETWNFADKLNNMESFYTNMNQAQQRQLLDNQHLCYILASPRSRAKGDAFQPTQWPDLVTVWSSINLTLYRTPYCR